MPIRARSIQVYLLAGVRLVCQMNRLGIGGLLPLAAAELGLSTAQKASLLSAFPFGYLLTQIAGGAAADRLGGKCIISLVLLSTAASSIVFSCLSSFAAMWAVLFVMGFLQGPCFPASGVLVARWVPGHERSRVTATLEVGNPSGAVLGLCGMPLLAEYFGWRRVLAAASAATLAYAGLWHVLAADSPRQCRYLSLTEAWELRELAQQGDAGEEAATPAKPAVAAPPWRILAIPSTWSVLFASVAFNFQRYFTYIWITAYSTDMLHAPVSSSTACMFWSNLADMVFALGAGKAADALAKSGRISTLGIRRLFATVGFVGTGTCLLLVGFVRQQASVTLLVALASGLHSCHVAGFKSSYTELSRAYSGVLSGLGNTFGSLSSFVVPLIGAAVLEAYGGSQNLTAWRMVFGTAFAAGALGAVLYAALVSTECLDERVAAPVAQWPPAAPCAGPRASCRRRRGAQRLRAAGAEGSPRKPWKERRTPLGLMLVSATLHAAGFPTASAPSFRPHPASPAPWLSIVSDIWG